MGLRKAAGGSLRLEPTLRFSVISVTACDAGAGRLRLYVNVPCSYTREIVMEALKRRDGRYNIVETPEQADVQWADYEDLDWDLILEGKARANSYLIRKGLSRKAQLAFYLSKYLSKSAHSPLAKAWPQTMVIETWEAFEEAMSFATLGAKFEMGTTAMSQRARIDWCLSEVKERLKRPDHAGRMWILKPSVTNKGAEVFVVRDFEGVRSAVHEWTDIREWVLQHYIDRPLLFRGRKFHLRVYVLAVGDLSVYVWRHVLLLSSALPYDREADDPLVHITNTARQAEGEDAFVETDCVYLLEDLFPELEQQQAPNARDAQAAVDQILHGIRETTGELFRALHGERTVFAPMPHCFELFGLDFLVTPPSLETERYQVHLLEVNPGPDFKQTGTRLSGVVEGLIDATVAKAVEGEREVEGLDLVYEDHERGQGLHVGGMRLFES